MKRIVVIALPLLSFLAVAEYGLAGDHLLTESERVELALSAQIEKGDWDRATAELRDNPGSLPAKLTRIRALGEQGRLPEALQEADSAVREHPNASAPLALRGECRRTLRDYQLAMKDLERALAIDPVNRWARLYRATLLGDLGRIQECVAELQRLVSTADAPPRTRYALISGLKAAGRLQEARQEAELEIKESPMDGRSYQSLAIIETALGNHAAAREAVDRAAELSPEDNGIWMLKASLRAKYWGEYDAAYADYAKAIQCCHADDQSRANIFREMAMMDYARGKYEAALPNVSEAVRLDPVCLLYRECRAEILFKLKRYRDARDDLSQAISDALSGKGKLTKPTTLIGFYRQRASANLFLGDRAAYDADLAEAERLEKEEANKKAGKP